MNGNNKKCRRSREWRFVTDLMNPAELYNTGSSESRVSEVLYVFLPPSEVWGPAPGRRPLTWPCNMSDCAAALSRRGHQCVLEETREWNMVELVVNGELVFSCHIKQLEFGELTRLWDCETILYLLSQGWGLTSHYLATCCAFIPKVEMGNWTLCAKRLLQLLRTLFDDNRAQHLNKDISPHTLLDGVGYLLNFCLDKIWYS